MSAGDDIRTAVRAALLATQERLLAAGVTSPSAEARTLVEEAARADGHLLLLRELPEDFDARLEQMLGRREQREPLQRIIGWAPFRRLRLRTAPGVFIPRPETELILEILRVEEPAARRIVDLCTGSGALAASILDEIPHARVTALELMEDAYQLATENVRAAAEARAIAADRWNVLRGDVRDPGALADAGPVDAVVANPPYIPAGAVPRDVEVREHDPEAALYGGREDGMEVPCAVIERAAELLRPGGLLVMEHADVQGEQTRRAARGSGGFGAVRTVRDLAGRERFLVARRAAGPVTADCRMQSPGDERLTA